MTDIELLKRVDSLAPLPKTVLVIQEFKKSGSYDTTELSEIIEKDPLMVSAILKTANSAMFGFVSKVDTLSRAINLMGINFAMSIAIGNTIKNSFNSELNAYNASSDEFLRIANMQSNLINLWIGKVDSDLKNNLILPAFLQESGKFLINKVLEDEGKIEKFAKKVKENPNNLSSIEKEYIGMSSSEVTAAIFKHWKLTSEIVGYIKFSDNPNNATSVYKKQAQILNISKNLCNIVDPLNDDAKKDAIKLADENGIHTNSLKAAISKMEDRILDD